MITKKQYQLLDFIDKRIQETGIPPSYDEMLEEVGIKSKSGIHRLIKSLEERGFIRRLPHKARAIEVIRRPRNMNPGPALGGFRPIIVEGSGDQDPLRGLRGGDLGGYVVELPLYGKIAAGTPIEALRDTSRKMEVPPSMIGSGEYYVLEIEGDSMIEAGILDGDMAVINRTDVANNGDIVVALVNNEEATLKRFRRRGASVALEPANANHETRIFGPDQIHVQGRLIGLIRRY